WVVVGHFRMRTGELPQLAESGGRETAAEQGARPLVAQARGVGIDPNRVPKEGIRLRKAPPRIKVPPQVVEEAWIVEPLAALPLELRDGHPRVAVVLIPGASQPAPHAGARRCDQ